LQEAVKRVYADELTNRTPPYEIRGGVHDSLVESRGDVLIADNESVRIAINMFLELEGIDIEPAAGVALACLRDAVNKGRIERESVVLLNITGGGRRRFRRDHSLIPAEPQLQLTRESLTTAEAMHRVTALTRTLEAIES
jgi:cysteate synthase